jgi:hypothetical protein
LCVIVFDFAFDLAFDFHPILTLPIVRDRKWIKKALCLSVASLKAFRFFVPHNWEAEGQWQRGRLSFAVFSLAKQRKDSSCRSTTDQRTIRLAGKLLAR